MNFNNPYAWPRKPLLAANAVATSQPLAAQAGLQMLAEGGTAVDAILATAITLTLVEPVSNGIGSDAYAIVWDGKRLHGLNAVGLRRRGFTPATLATLKRAYRMLFQASGARRDAVARTREALGHVREVAHLLDFVVASQRGVCR